METSRVNRKRKRKNKIPNNISKLEITIADSTVNGKTPMLHCNQKRKILNRSPILETSCTLPSNSKCPYKSPIIPLKDKQINHNVQEKNDYVKSPILVQKHCNYKSYNVKRKLFAIDKFQQENGCPSLLSTKVNTQNSTNNNSLNDVSCKKNSEKCNRNCVISNYDKFEYNLDTSPKQSHTHSKDKNMLCKIDKNLAEKESPVNINLKSTLPESPSIRIKKDNLDGIVSIKTYQKDEQLVNVKCYFDKFSISDSNSTCSIHDILSQNEFSSESKTSLDIELVQSLTQEQNEKIKELSEQVTTVSSDTVTVKSKKKYRKDGLAYRLDNLIKKQSANISIFHQERFLPVNLNCIYSKTDYLVFQVQVVYIKYNLYLLKAKKLDNNEDFLIVISAYNVYYNNMFKTNTLFKLFKPYYVSEIVIDQCKLILNACKFECIGNN